MNSLSRRRLLEGAVATTAVTAVTGCVFGESVTGGHLFVENQADEPHRVALSVTEGTDDPERLVNAEYRLPARRGLQFEALLESGTTYDIRARQPEVVGVGAARLAVPVETCQEGEPSDKLDVVVRISANGPDIVTHGCDRSYTRNADLEYADPSEYRIGTITGTIPPPTPTS